MRKVWYQNNQRFNPIFKINDRLNDRIQKNSVVSQSIGNPPINSGNNPVNTGGKEGGNIFNYIQNVKTNQ